MKRLTLLLVLLLASTITLCAQGDPYARVQQGDRLPEFEVAMLDGTTLISNDLSGKVVWICLWASWCPSCRKELRWLTQSEEFLALLEHEEFVFLPIAREENSATVGAWLREKDYGFTSAVDPERKVYELFAEQEIPRNIIVGRDGVIQSHSSAYSKKALGALIEQTQKMLNLKDM